jgi:hypothetical protein
MSQRARVIPRTLVALVFLLMVSSCAKRIPATSVPPPPPPAAAQPEAVAGSPAEEESHAFLAAEANVCGVHCGTERWRVKTLSGTGAQDVDFTPQTKTVKQLNAPKTPASLSDTQREADVEKQTVKVRGILVGYKREPDKDLHVVIADRNDPEITMIVEIPDPDSCSFACNSAHANEYRTARAAFLSGIKDHKATKCFRNMDEDGIEIIITGVPMFDRQHGQTGAAANGLEIHPVLKVEWPSSATHGASCSSN